MTDNNGLFKDYEVDVSVCIITYFHERYIKDALESVLSQKTKYSFEKIVGYLSFFSCKNKNKEYNIR